MNRKLHNSLMALSTTGLLLVVGLMAATPVVAPAGTEAALADAEAAAAHTRVDAETRRMAARRAREAAVEARALAFEAEFRRAIDAQQAIAATASLAPFVAAAATEAALAEAAAEQAAATTEPPAREPPRRKRRSARSSLALPYFSFARGLRGGNGG